MKMKLFRSRKWSTLLMLSGLFISASAHATIVDYVWVPDVGGTSGTLTIDDESDPSSWVLSAFDFTFSSPSHNITLADLDSSPRTVEATNPAGVLTELLAVYSMGDDEGAVFKLMTATYCEEDGEPESDLCDTFFDDDAGGITYTGEWAVVPVPAAVWLFGSGLIGLIGIARRKKTS
jgi:hypothetical protein